MTTGDYVITNDLVRLPLNIKAQATSDMVNGEKNGMMHRLTGM